MNILILTGKFGMGHWSASQSLRQQLLRAFPGAEVEVLDFVAEAMPNASEAMYKCFNLLVTRGSGLFNLYYKLTQDLPADARPLFETLFLDKLEELVAARRPDAVIATHPSAPGWCPAGRGDGERPAPHHLRHRPVQPFRVDSQIHRLLSGGLQRHPQPPGRQGVDRDIICVTGIPVRCEFKRPVRRRPGRERNLLIMGAGWACCPSGTAFMRRWTPCPASTPPSSPATTASSTTAWRASMPTSRRWASPTGYTTTWPGRIWCSPSPAALPCLRPSSPSCPSWRGSPFWSRRRTTPASW